jgi:penicillin G amidase
MKILRTLMIGLLILVILAFVAGGVFLRYTSRKALPDYSRDIALNGLSAEVTVSRDSFAIPHILASSEYDVYRATGYLMAQDRLWQMDLLRRLTTGRLSEIFGKDLVSADQLFRSLRFTEKSKTVIDSCSTEIKACLQAFSDGVNQYIRDAGNKLPPEFTILGYKPEPWEPVYSANLIGYMAWGLTTPWTTETVIYKTAAKAGDAYAKELIPDKDLQKFYIHNNCQLPEKAELVSELDHVNRLVKELGLEVFQASNNWVVSAVKSKTGKPILANDMHLDLNAPGIWYQIHQEVPGKLNVTGVALPGQPFVICGHNDRIAWGMTNVMLDDMDFYIETLSPADTSRYKFNGEWLPLKTVKESIATKEGDTIVRYNRFTHRGPIISGFKGIGDKVVSMRWTGNEYSNELVSVYKFDRAGNWNEFRNAASTFISVSQNAVYADVDGNIGMQTAAGVPIREGNPVMFYPGDTSLYDWKGLVPFDELPSSYNPTCGYLASANNRTIGDSYPHYISAWYFLPFRYQAIVEGLTAQEKLGVDEFKAIQADQRSRFAAKLAPFFLENLSSRTSEMDATAKTAYDLLGKWDFSMPVLSVQSTIFEQTYLELIRVIFADEMGEDIYGGFTEGDLMAAYYIDALTVKKESIWFDNIRTTDKKESLNDDILAAFTVAVNTLKGRLGDDVSKWQWGNVHNLTLYHPLGKVKMLARAFDLNRGPYPVGGSYHTVSPYTYPFSDPYNANNGSSHRHIFTVGDWDNSQTIIPTGESGIPASKFYCDQSPLYVKYIYHADPFSTESVEKHREFVMKFKP